MTPREVMIDKFDKIKEIMKDYRDICNYDCHSGECPFLKTVGYNQLDGEIAFCDAIDGILE